MKAEQIATSDDTSALWTALMAAKESGDAETVRAIEQRMRELSESRRFAELSDEELRRRIDALTSNLEPKGLLAHSPDGVIGAGWIDVTYTSRNNAAIRENQHGGGEATLAALHAEYDRRHPRDAG
jgi:hypothetical protein